ncbi:MAG: TorF family putative porin [Pseudomonadota bacterium]
MKMKKLALALMAATGMGMASAANAESELSISTTWAYESEYIFRGVQFSDHSFQPDLSISYGGAYFGVWGAIPLADNDVTYADEIDYYGGYSFDITETVAGDVGFTYYTFPDSGSGFFDDDVNTFEIFAGVSFDAPLAPSAYIYYDFDLEAFTVQGDAGYSFPLAESTSLDFGGYVGFVTPDEGEDYTYYGVSADVSYAFTDDASGSIGVRWAGATEDTFYGDPGVYEEDNSVWFGVSFGSGF